MNEEKLNPMLSYDKEQKKPILLNDEAMFACVNYIKDKTKAEVNFDADELFYEYMATEGYDQPSQEEVNEFVWKMVEECSQLEEEELEPLPKIMIEKAGGNVGDTPMGC